VAARAGPSTTDSASGTCSTSRRSGIDRSPVFVTVTVTVTSSPGSGIESLTCRTTDSDGAGAVETFAYAR
jgi:hypothetical protein